MTKRMGRTICDIPPFHAPVFVLHPPRAGAAADGRRHHVLLRPGRNRVGTGTGTRGGDVSIHGGATTINQYRVRACCGTSVLYAQTRHETVPRGTTHCTGWPVTRAIRSKSLS
jgi:hypothetical protein